MKWKGVDYEVLTKCRCVSVFSGLLTLKKTNNIIISPRRWIYFARKRKRALNRKNELEDEDKAWEN